MLFANSRQRVYIKRDFDFERLSQHAESDDVPLVIWHFCGSSADSTNPIVLLRRIMLNLKSFFEMEDELPSTEDNLVNG